MPESPEDRLREAGKSTKDDGTRQLLRWGGSMVGMGVLSALLLETVLGFSSGALPTLFTGRRAGAQGPIR